MHSTGGSGLMAYLVITEFGHLILTPALPIFSRSLLFIKMHELWCICYCIPSPQPPLNRCCLCSETFSLLVCASSIHCICAPAVKPVKITFGWNIYVVEEGDLTFEIFKTSVATFWNLHTFTVMFGKNQLISRRWFSAHREWLLLSLFLKGANLVKTKCA